MSDASRCGACGAGAVVNGVCGRCGAAEGEPNRCPHCGSVARVEARGAGETASWVCAVCGGPRIPGGLGGEDAIRALKEAKAFLSTRTRARATSIAWGILAAFATLFVVAATAKAVIGASLVLAVLAIVPAVLAMRARGRAGAAQASADEAQGRAWAAAAEDAARRSPGGITASELARKLQIDDARADRLLTELAVHDRTRVDVGDDAEVRYCVEPRLRVRPGAEAGAAAAEAEADADADADASRTKGRTR